MGCHGEYIEKASDLRPALVRAVDSGKPAVIHTVVDPVANIDPPGLYQWNMARSGNTSF